MRFSTIGLSSLILLALSGTAGAAAPSRPFLQVGSFSPSSAKPLGPNAADTTLESMARNVLADRVAWSTKLSLAPARVASLRDGRRIVKLPQTHQGLAVFARGATVTFGTDGLAHVIAQRLEEQLPADVTPSIAIEDAAKTASDVAKFPMGPQSGKLVIWPMAGKNILAWHFYAPARYAIAYAPVVIIDAKTGDVVTHYNAVLNVHQASVFPSNPVKSPQTMNVTVPLPPDATLLSDPLVTARNCIDKKTTIVYKGTTIHSCELVQTAIADAASLDFLQTPSTDTDPEDPFAELHIYYHTHRIYEHFQGFQANFMVQAAPIDVVANLRNPPGSATGDITKVGDVNLPLEPFSNAFFSPAGDDFYGTTGGAMFFGQGPNKDYAYDADVVYHEFTHAVVNATVQFVYTPHMDAYGVVSSPGAMNEGLADYFAAALTGDPDYGEYAALDRDPNATSTRSLAAADKCPTAISGEFHVDSTLFAAGLWDVRKNLTAAEQESFDLAVFAAMNAAPSGDLGFEEMAEIIRAQIETSSLGMTVATQVYDAFTNRGVFPQCKRILEYTGTPLEGPLPIKDFGNAWLLPGLGITGLLNNPLGYAPGLFQVHYPISGDVGTLDIEFIADGASGFSPKAIVRFGNQPIQFTYDPYSTTDDVLKVTMMRSGTDVATYRGSIAIPPDATEAYVMVVNGANNSGGVTKLKLSTAASMSSSSSGNPGTSPSADDGSCACSIPGSATGPAWAALASLAAFAGHFARRRRR